MEMKNAKSNVQICADLKCLSKELLKVLDETKIDKNMPTSGGVPRATVQPLAKKRRWWRVLSYRFWNRDHDDLHELGGKYGLSSEILDWNVYDLMDVGSIQAANEN